MPRKLPESKPLRRSSSTRKPLRKSIYIICEGSVTEPNYFLRLKEQLKNPLIDIHPIPKGGPIRVLIGKVLDLEKQLRETAKKSGDRLDSLYSVWGVPDVDAHPKLAEATNLAREHKLNIAISNPCFELWGIFHYTPQDAPITRHAAQKKLKKLMKGYCHKSNPIFNMDEIEGKIQDAIKHSKNSLLRRLDEGDANGNPSSNMHELIYELLPNRK